MPGHGVVHALDSARTPPIDPAIDPALDSVIDASLDPALDSSLDPPTPTLLHFLNEEVD
jgi:hypothetical protein